MILDIANALKEVLSKTEGQLQIETAYKWAARAIACYRLYESSQRQYWLLRAEQYRHEAIEHAASAEDGCFTLKFLEREMSREAKQAGIL